ncbi:DUF488 domain-containing protein [Solilutibacter pythonis]|nr:DUF488 domain-containing protein [Lysobacter pythonis]
MALQIKRAYRPAASDDGQRILVDRLWPRGLSKEKAHLHGWLKDLAPSDRLRRWFDHDPTKWAGFRQRYAAELDANPAPVAELRALLKKGKVTLVYAARDEQHNNAVALKDYLGG